MLKASQLLSSNGVIDHASIKSIMYPMVNICYYYRFVVTRINIFGREQPCSHCRNCFKTIVNIPDKTILTQYHQEIRR